MKKNVMMRIASILLVCVLATTCGISGTFAKYVAADTATDNARVAKWGVLITQVTDDASMFVKSYSNGGSVVVKSTTDVVAPGTSGFFASFEVNGQPEVDATIKCAVTEVTFTNWELTPGDAGTFYCPLVFTIGTTVIDGTSFEGNKPGLINAIVAAVAAQHKYEVEADQPMSTYSPSVSWAWAFDGNDAKDTVLGNQATTANAPTISMTVTCTIEQSN